MKINHLIYGVVAVAFTLLISLIGNGCAQIGAPTGGPRDSLPPVLVGSNPNMLTTDFANNKIVLYFNEYIDVQDVQNNVLVSPFPKINPLVDFKLKTVTVRLKDTLLPNTTYSINFGNAIRDNNEGNPFRNFTYVFSTGKTIDSLQLAGKVIVAETGKKDSNIIAMLYRNVPDSAVQTRKPDYVARVDSAGNFTFRNLSAGRYKVYALKDGNGDKTYDSKTELFAFNDQEMAVTDTTPHVTLYAYAEEKDTKKVGTGISAAEKKAQADKKLRYVTTLTGNEQDLLTDLVVSFSKPLKSYDPQKILLTDSNYNKIAAVVRIDSTQKNIHVSSKWVEDFHYRFILNKDAVSDSTGVQLTKTDTIRFKTKKEGDYGNLVIRFSNLSPATHPVLQFFKGEEIYKSIPVTAATWTDKLFVPGEYELRILFDANNNGVWDPGSYEKKLQPEKAITLNKTLNVKANWDNEREIRL